MIEQTVGMLTEEELELASRCVEIAKRLGANGVRISLSKSLMELFGTLNGELDKVSHCLDRSLSANLYVDGSFGSFSTNHLDEKDLENFLAKAIAMVRMLAKDKCRRLPDVERTCKSAVIGDELGLFDSTYSQMAPEQRRKLALDGAIFKKGLDSRLISEEGEYSDTIIDTYLIDSNGLKCRHTETSFEYGVEVTVQDGEGNKYSGYWWDSSPFFAKLDIGQCGTKALSQAVNQINPQEVESGVYNMVVDSEVASKLVKPILSALGAYSLQQNNSFLLDSVGKKLFPDCLTILDRPSIKGESGSRLYDSEGVATKEAAIIKDGVVEEYFINTYMSEKMEIAPTIEDYTRAEVLACVNGAKTEEKLDRKRILELTGDGILVTGFNGGNSNTATGDFSYGIEGFLFKNGKIIHPLREMLITGNFLTLWGDLLAAGNDCRRCNSNLIPTLAFGNVHFSA